MRTLALTVGKELLAVVLRVNLHIARWAAARGAHKRLRTRLVGHSAGRATMGGIHERDDVGLRGIVALEHASCLGISHWAHVHLSEALLGIAVVHYRILSQRFARSGLAIGIGVALPHVLEQRRHDCVKVGIRLV